MIDQVQGTPAAVAASGVNLRLNNGGSRRRPLVEYSWQSKDMWNNNRVTIGLTTIIGSGSRGNEH